MSNEVCSVVDTDQFVPGKTPDACGFFSVALLKYAGKQAPTGNAQQITDWASSEYAAYDGPDISSNTNGMTVPTLYNVIKDAGLHYQAIGARETGYATDHLTAEYIRAWSKYKYPIILSVAEDDVYDLDLNRKPYAWDTTGFYHVITCTGFDGNALLCHDTASIDQNGVRRGPRRYDALRLQNGLTSATVVVMPWLERPQEGFDPTKETHMLPQGWTDTNGKLTCPNGHFFAHGFRDVVLQALSSGENPGDLEALENEQHVPQVELHAKSGSGTRQIVNKGMLIWTQSKGVKWSAAGPEIARCYQDIITLENKVKSLEAQIKAVPPPSGTSAIGEAITPLQALLANATLLEQEVVQALDTQKATVQGVIAKLQGK